MILVTKVIMQPQSHIQVLLSQAQYDRDSNGQTKSVTIFQVLLGLARYDGDSRRDKATVVRLATTFLKSQQVN